MEKSNEKADLENRIKKLDEQIALLTEIKQKCQNQINKLSLQPSGVPEQIVSVKTYRMLGYSINEQNSPDIGQLDLPEINPVRNPDIRKCS